MSAAPKLAPQEESMIGARPTVSAALAWLATVKAIQAYAWTTENGLAAPVERDFFVSG